MMVDARSPNREHAPRVSAFLEDSSWRQSHVAEEEMPFFRWLLAGCPPAPRRLDGPVQVRGTRFSFAPRPVCRGLQRRFAR
jgi:hypothetical protein